MKKILATALTLVSLLGSISLLSSAEEQNTHDFSVCSLNNLKNENDSNNGTLVAQKTNLSEDLSKNMQACLDSFNKCLEPSLIITSNELKDKYNNCSLELTNCLTSSKLDSYMSYYKTRSYIGDWLLFIKRIFSCIGQNYKECLYENF